MKAAAFFSSTLQPIRTQQRFIDGVGNEAGINMRLFSVVAVLSYSLSVVYAAQKAGLINKSFNIPVIADGLNEQFHVFADSYVDRFVKWHKVAAKETLFCRKRWST